MEYLTALTSGAVSTTYNMWTGRNAFLGSPNSVSSFTKEQSQCHPSIENKRASMRVICQSILNGRVHEIMPTPIRYHRERIVTEDQHTTHVSIYSLTGFCSHSTNSTCSRLRNVFRRAQSPWLLFLDLENLSIISAPARDITNNRMIE